MIKKNYSLINFFIIPANKSCELKECDIKGKDTKISVFRAVS